MTEQVKRQAEERVALARAQAARAAAEEATRRLHFLAEASTVLGRSLDVDGDAARAWRAWPCRSWPISPPPCSSSRTASWRTEAAGAPRAAAAAARAISQSLSKV